MADNTSNVGSIEITTRYVVDERSIEDIRRSIGQVGQATEEVNKRIEKTSKVVGGLGKAIGAVFSAKVLGGFSKKITSIGSDMVETQNIINETFKDTANAIERINQFADEASGKWGLNEKQAKLYVGMLGAMTKSMGLGSNEAMKLGMNMTKLTADMASFYNMTEDEVFSKIRSGLSGQTQGLKSMGIVMSQAALESFAMERGITKSLSAMSEQEKVILRYNYLLSVTKDQQNDFARTNADWSNQVKILSNSLNEMFSVIGQIVIKVALPIVTAMGSIIKAITEATKRIGVFFNLLGGKDVTLKGMGDKKSTGAMSSGLEDIESGAGAASGALGDVADGYKKAGKEAKKAMGGLASFDNVIQLSKDMGSSGSGGGKGGKGGKGVGGGSFDMGLDEYADVEIKGAEEKFSGFMDKIRDMLVIDIPPLDLDFDKEKIINNFKKITDDIIHIVVNMVGLVVSLFSRMWNDLKMPDIVGAVTDVVASVTGLVRNMIETISPSIIKFYDVGLSPIVVWIGEKLVDALQFASVELDKWSEWVAENNDGFVRLAEVIGIVVNKIWELIEPLLDSVWEVFKVVIEKIGEALRDVFSFILDNSEAIISALVGIGTAVLVYKGIMGAISFITFIKGLEGVGVAAKLAAAGQALLNTVMSLNPYVLVTSLLAGVVAGIVVLYNTSDTAREKIDAAFEKIKETFSVFKEVVGGILDNVIESLKKFGSFIKEVLVADIDKAFGDIDGRFGLFKDMVKTTIEGVRDIFKGLIDFIVGAFTGDWDRAFKGLAGIVKGVFEGIGNIMLAPFKQFTRMWNNIASSIGNLAVPDWVPGIGGKGFSLPQIQEPRIKLAKGGVVTGRTWAEIGEAGAEAVVPLENSNFIKSFAGQVGESMYGRGGVGGDTIIINLEGANILGDNSMDMFVEKIAEALENKGRRTGKPIYLY